MTATVNYRLLASAFVAALLSGCGSGNDSAIALSCDEFRFQEDAQDYYRRNNATWLDGDGNGIACEDLPRSGTAASPR